MTRQLISTNRQLLLRHVTRSVRRAAGFVQVRFWEVSPDSDKRAKLHRLRGYQVGFSHTSWQTDCRRGIIGAVKCAPFCAPPISITLILRSNRREEQITRTVL